MSWQATVWAERQKTGSPARKVLLLVIANYADEQGYCYPSQRRLAEGTEQSVDTVQRHLRKLETDGHIRIEKNERRGGRWPRHAYYLNMADGPQIAVQRHEPSGEKSPSSARTDRARCGSDRAALSPKTGPQALRHEYLDNIQSQPSPDLPTLKRVEAHTATGRTRAEVQRLQREVVEELGNGNVECGWLIFGKLSGHQRQLLERLASQGQLTVDEIAVVCGPARRERLQTKVTAP